MVIKAGFMWLSRQRFFPVAAKCYLAVAVLAFFWLSVWLKPSLTVDAVTLTLTGLSFVYWLLFSVFSMILSYRMQYNQSSQEKNMDKE